MTTVRIAGAGVPDLPPGSLTAVGLLCSCFKVALSYILRFAAHPDVGDRGDTSMHKTVEGMADVTVVQPKVSGYPGLDLPLFLLT